MMRQTFVAFLVLASPASLTAQAAPDTAQAVEANPVDSKTQTQDDQVQGRAGATG